MFRTSGGLVGFVIAVPTVGYVSWPPVASVCRTFQKFLDSGGATSSDHDGRYEIFVMSSWAPPPCPNK